MKPSPRIVWLNLAAVCVLALLGAGAASAQSPAPGSATRWSYSGADGPDHWGELDPKFAACKTGKLQSPIDIQDPRPADLHPLRFDYKLSPLKIIDTGYTIRINVEPGSSVIVDGKSYPLVQFHFHHPSEEEINGAKFDMVVHLVHQLPDAGTVVVAILLKSGNENALIRDLWSHLPKETNKEVEFKKIVINAADFLPADQNYYTFGGSLTIPPCSKGVQWFVLKTPVELSASQIAKFARMYPDNARPIQPVNGRAIGESNFQKQ
jgi:carbonic anhydrase